MNKAIFCFDANSVPKKKQVGDVIESYEVVRRSRTLEEASAAKTENQKNAKEAKREAVGV